MSAASSPKPRRVIITIDGPAGTGKSTVAHLLAKHLGLEFLDTGAMYRASALVALERGIPPENGPELAGAVIDADLHFDWKADPPKLMIGYRSCMASQRSARRWWMCWVFTSLGGVGLSIMVAWSCALWSPMTTQSGILRLTANEPMPQAILRHGHFDQFTYNGGGGFGWHRERLVAGRSQYEDYKPSTLHRMRAGWPFLCMGGHWQQIDGRQTEHWLAELPRLPKVNRNGLTKIPLRPIWGGLLLNSLLLMFPIHVLFARHAIRRALRRHRGLCLKCGYDLRGAPGLNGNCSECGVLND